MANRLLIGTRTSSDSGLFISKSGFNVLTDVEANLLWSSNLSELQFVASGQISLSAGASTNIFVPYDLGYSPALIVVGAPQVYQSNGYYTVEPNVLWVTYVSATQITITNANNSVSRPFSYAITRLAANV